MTDTAQRKLTVAAACLGWLFSAVDVILLILFQREVAESLGVDAQPIRMAIGVGLMGSAVGGIVLSQLGDRFGRVRVLGWSVIVYSVATAGMALAPNIGALIGLRFVAGIGTGGEWSLGMALIAEVWPRARRGTLGGLVAGMFNLGTFVCIGLYQSGMGWRAAFGVMLLPALGVTWLRRHVPESPVWQALMEARAAGRLDPVLEASMRRAPVSALLRGAWLGVTAKATVLFTIMNFAFFSFSTVFINFLQSDRTAGGLGLTPREQFPYQLTLNAAGLVGVVLAGTLSDRLGRRAVYAAFCVLGVAGYGWLYGLTRGGDLIPGAELLFTFAVICLSYGINGVMGSFASELFPTHLRSAGPGFCQNVGKGIGGMSGPPLAGALVPTLGYAAVLALPGALLALLALLIWSLPAVGGRAVQAIETDGFLRGDGAQG